MNTKRFKNLILGNILGADTSVAIPSGYYLGLAKNVTVSGNSVTVTGEPAINDTTNYQRISLSGKLGTPTNGVVSNNVDISFNESKTDWFPSSGQAAYYVIFDAASGGNPLMYNTLTSTKTIEKDTVATIRANNLQISLEDGE